MATITASEREQLMDTLGKCYPRGGTVYGILRSVARSGMSRKVSLVAISEADPAESYRVNVWHPNYAAAKVCGLRMDRKGARDAIIVGGCGFDALSSIADDISYALYGQTGQLRSEWL